jgi:hypothetical protein
MARVKDDWLIFVDTNIFLDFYRMGSGVAEKQLAALERHANRIIMGDQVRMEFLKNRQKVIVGTLKSMKKLEKPQFPPLVAKFDPARMVDKHMDDAVSNYKKVTKKISDILRNPSANDKVYQSFNRIFEANSPLNLRRPNKVRFEIRNLARKRFVLGYPPRKSADTSIGDAMNWEWIIHCAEKSSTNQHVMIVSRDADFGETFDNVTIINDWLRREFKDRDSRKRNIELTTKLTVALKLLDEAVSKEDELEENRIIDEQERIDAKAENPLRELLQEVALDP